MIYRIVRGVKPLSFNQAWRHHGHITYSTKEYKQYQKDMAILLGKPDEQLDGWLEIELSIGFPKKIFSRTDIDNYCKATIDILCKAGYISNDNKILKLTASKFLSEDYEIHIKIDKSTNNPQ